MSRPRLYLILGLALFAAVTGAVAEEAAPAPAAPAPAAPAPAAPAPAAEAPPPEPELKSLAQVQIQVWISQIDERGDREIGTNLNYTRFKRRGQTHPGLESTGDALERVGTNTFTPDFAASVPAPDGGWANGPINGYNFVDGHPDDARLTPESRTVWTPRNVQAGTRIPNQQEGAGLSWSIVDSDRGTIDGIFRSLEKRTDSDLISKPELLVVDGAQATINAGDEYPYQAVAYKNGQPQLSITWRKLGVEMELTPTIASPELVQLNITKLDVVDLLTRKDINNLLIPVFSTRSQTGMVMVPDGETLVIGGLNSQIERRVEKRVPIAGRIPLLGVLFRGRTNDALKSHLLIFVSPTIVDVREYTDRMEKAMNFWREEQWTNADAIESEIDSMPNEL
ncbi:MAG: type II and III secretion system protein [bacterium]|nr:type II and III secretion system protein [bacterium]